MPVCTVLQGVLEMSPFVRVTYVSVFTTLLVYLAYCWWVFQVMGVDYFVGTEDSLVRIGKTIGSFILLGHAFEWFVLFCVISIGAKLSGNKIVNLVFDERDKQISHRSMSISRNVLCIGIFLSIGALAIGWAPFWVFNIIVHKRTWQPEWV